MNQCVEFIIIIGIIFSNISTQAVEKRRYLKERARSKLTLEEQHSASVVSKEIETTFDGETGAFGNIFSLQAFRRINITSLSLHLNESGTVKVWTKIGEISTDSEAITIDEWKLVASTYLESSGKRRPTQISNIDFETVQMVPDSIMSFLVQIEEKPCLLTTEITDKETMQPFTISKDFVLLIGSAINNSGKTTQRMQWNGLVHYQVIPNKRNQLSTSFANDPGKHVYAISFRIKSWVNDLFITTFDLQLLTVGNETMKVFVRDETNPIWEEVCNTKVAGKGNGGISSIPSEAFTPVELVAGQAKDFLIVSNNSLIPYSSNWYKYDSTNKFVAFNDELLIEKGNTYNVYNQLLEHSTAFNGIVRYSTKQFPDCLSLKTFPIEATGNTDYYYGAMFTISSSDIAFIETLKFFSSSTSVPYTVWTRPGAFDDISRFAPYEWTYAAHGLTGTNEDIPSMIDPIHFTPFEITQNFPRTIFLKMEGRALSLMTKTLYQNNAVASDGIIHISSAREVNFEGEITETEANFYGAIYYSSKAKCKKFAFPSEAPTSLPTAYLNTSLFAVAADLKEPQSNEEDSQAKEENDQTQEKDDQTKIQNPDMDALSLTLSPTLTIEVEKILYLFSVVHENSETGNVLKIVDSHVQMSLTRFINSRTEAHSLIVHDGEITLVSVESRFGPDENVSPCTAHVERVCSLVETTISVSYNPESVAMGIVRYLILSQASYITGSLSFHKQDYIGLQTLLSVPTLSFDNIVSDHPEPNVVMFYETTMMSLLNSLVKIYGDSIKVTYVTTSTKDLIFFLARRMEEQKVSDTLELVTGFIGEYIPPPTVDFDEVVLDSIETNSAKIVKELKKQSFFENVDGVTVSYPLALSADESPITELDIDTFNKDDDGDEISNSLIILLASCVTFFIVAVILLISVRNVRIRDRHAAELKEFDSALTSYFPRSEFAKRMKRESFAARGKEISG